MTVDTTKLRELAKKATPGPWYSKWPEERCAWKDIGPGRYPVAYTGDCFDDAPNAEFIAAANPSAVLALLDKLDGTESMFLAACADLGAINKLLGLDPDDGGAEPILYEVKRLLAIEAAARNLVKVKGRHNSEIAMNRLQATLAASE